MRRRQRWLASAPLPIVFFEYATAFGVASFISDLGVHEQASWRERVIVVLLSGVLMTAVTAWQRRREGGKGLQLLLAEAMENGELPADADRAQWEELLARKKREYETAPVVTAFLLVAVAGICVLVALADGWVWLLLTGACAVLIMIAFRASWRDVARIDRLQEQLVSASPSDPI